MTIRMTKKDIIPSTRTSRVLLGFLLVLISIQVHSAFALVTQSTNPVPNGLIGWWTLDTVNTYGGFAYDKSTTTSRTGTITGSPTVVTGTINQGLTFSGSSQYIDAGTSPITGTQAFTLSAWIKPTAFDNNYHGALSIGGSSVGANAYIGLVGTTQGGTANTIGGGIYGSNYGSGVAVTSTWSHVVLTFSGGSGGTLTLYVNGVAKFTTTATPSLTSTNIKIGRIGTDTIYDFSGGIDDARLYNRALSAAEVKALYGMRGSTVVTIGELYYPKVTALLHGEGTASSTTITDQKGHTFTTSGNAHISTTQFKYGSASMVFDGNTDYVSSADSPDWDLTGPFTIEAWFYPTTANATKSIIDRWLNGGLVGSSFAILANGSGLTAWIPNNTDGRYDAGHTDLITSNSYTVNAWNHLALTWDGTTYRLFLNGGTPATASRSTGMYDGARPLTIGGLSNFAGSYDFSGYIDEVRITKGVARYTASFTPSTTQFADKYAPVSTKQAPVNTKVVGSGLIGYWTFDGPRLTTSTATDSMGTRDGTFVNGPTADIGVIGQGLKTGNPGGHLALGDTFDMGLNSMTLSVWFKSTNLQYAGAPVGLMGKALWGNQNGRYGIYVNSGTMYAFLETTSETLVSTDVSSYNDNKFHLLTVVYDRTGNLTMYIDGVSKNSASISAKSGDNVQTANTFLIGKYNDASGTDTAGDTFSFNGTLDDARVYNRALSASEVLQLYKMGGR